VFDDDNFVSLAGPVPVIALAEQTAFSELLAAYPLRCDVSGRVRPLPCAP
jgi:hypothetical protein